MKYVLEVCLIAITAGNFVSTTAAQSPAMQKGISVELPVSTNSAPVPAADNEDAFIVTITNTGAVYLGVNPITLPDLREKVRSTPFKHGQALYIKADARTPYATVLQILDVTRTEAITPQILLTAPTQSATSGTMVLPEGVEVQMARPLPSPRAGVPPLLAGVVRSGV